MAGYRNGHRWHATDNADLQAIEDSYLDMDNRPDLDAVSAEWFTWDPTSEDDNNE